MNSDQNDKASNDDVHERQRRAEVEAREFAAMVEELCPDGGFLFGE